MANPARKPEHGEERARTDAGRTGDKVAVGDPAAAPLHSDAETAGTPTPAKQAATSAHRQEKIAETAKPKAAPAPFASGHQPYGGGTGLWFTAAIGVGLVAAGIVAGWISAASL